MSTRYDTIQNNSTIAILLGVYNGGLYLKEQLDSLLAQTYTNWTLYIRDDASTDNTADIIDQYNRQNKNIIQICDQDGNLGCNGNYFRLLEIVKSQYYMFCNADDFWFQDKIEISFRRMLKEESEHKEIPVIVHTDLSITDSQLNTISNSYWESTNVNPEKFKKYNMLGLCCIVAGATMLFNYKVKQLVTFPVHPQSPFFDCCIALQVVDRGIIASIHRPTIAYRQIGTNLAAVAIGQENSLIYKILHLKKIFLANKEKSSKLKNIGWGGIIKYLFFKVKVILILRFGHSYKASRYCSQDE